MTTKKRLLGVTAVLAVITVAFGGGVAIAAVVQPHDDQDSVIERMGKIVGIGDEDFVEVEVEVNVEDDEDFDADQELTLESIVEMLQRMDSDDDEEDVESFRLEPEARDGDRFWFSDEFGDETRRELEADAIEDWIETLVEEGVVTANQAEEMREWLPEQGFGWSDEGSVRLEIEQDYTFMRPPLRVFRGDTDAESVEDWLSELFGNEKRGDSWMFDDREDGGSWMEEKFGDEGRYGWFGFDENDEELMLELDVELIEDLLGQSTLSDEFSDQLEEWFEMLEESFGSEMTEFPSEGTLEFDSGDGKFRFRGSWGWEESDEFEYSNDEDEESEKKGISYGDPI